jgi:hypothetical protein
MSIGGYGQQLARRGLQGLSAQGNRDARRQVLDAARVQDQDATTGENVGLMVGGLVRGGIGVYDERKEKFEKEHPGQDYSALDELQGLFKEWW